jgi:hypothetical protein
MLFLIFFIFLNFYIIAEDFFVSNLKKMFFLYIKNTEFLVLQNTFLLDKKNEKHEEKVTFYKKYPKIEVEIENLIERCPSYLIQSLAEKNLEKVNKKIKSEVLIGIKNIKIYFLKNILNEYKGKVSILEDNNKIQENKLKEKDYQIINLTLENKNLKESTQSSQLNEPLLQENKKKSCFLKCCCCFLK